MARGTTLGELVEQLRIEANLDPTPAFSTNLVPSFKQALRKEQERLYDEFDWPHLLVTTDKQLAAGQRYYDVPANLDLERIIKVDVKYGGEWLPVEKGIELAHYSVHDSDEDARQSPVQLWDVRDTGSGEQIEVWPIPLDNYDAATGNGALRFTGTRKLGALVADDDTADLDDAVIVLFCAAERLVSAGDKDTAQIKFNKAKARLKTLQGRITRSRRSSFGLGTRGTTDVARQAPVIVVKSE